MNPTTKVIALASGVVLSAAGVAAGDGDHGGKRAKVYGAKLAKTAAATDPAYARLAGRAHLVDGRKHNPLVVHVRHLKPKAAYTFELSTAACDQASATVAEFGVVSATSNAAGSLNKKATSAAFNAAGGTIYSVVVKEGSTAIACGPLAAKHQNGTFTLPKPHKPSARPQGRGRSDKAHGCRDKESAKA